IGSHILWEIASLCRVQPVISISPRTTFVYSYIIVDKRSSVIGFIILTIETSETVSFNNMLWRVVHFIGCTFFSYFFFSISAKIVEITVRSLISITEISLVTFREISSQVSFVFIHRYLKNFSREVSGNDFTVA